MVGTLSTQRFFKPAEPAGADWHAFRDDATMALCGMVAIRYNSDEIADSLPDGGKLHSFCKDALDAADGVVAEPEVTTAESEAQTEGEITSQGVLKVIEDGRITITAEKDGATAEASFDPANEEEVATARGLVGDELVDEAIRELAPPDEGDPGDKSDGTPPS